MMVIIVGPVMAAENLYTNGRFLYTACNEKIVLVGVNRMVTYWDRTGSSLSEIAQTGANAVRLVALTSDSAADLNVWLKQSIDNHMVPIPELHDATGNLAMVPQMVDWWVRPDIVDVLKKHRRYVIINIANEASGDCSGNVSNFVSTYTTAIQRIRNAGLMMPLLIDGPCWAHDTTGLRNAASSLYSADPNRNLIFSNHFYGKDQSGGLISFDGQQAHLQTEIAAWVATGLPFLWGEFSNYNPPIDYLSLINLSNASEIGWLAWSWHGNTESILDMSNNATYNGLYNWGLEVAVTDADSIKNTAVRPASLSNMGCC